MSSENQNNPPARHKKNWLEWTVFGASCLLVLATFGYLIRQVIVSEEGPPKLEIRLGDPERSGDGVRIPVFVTNRGHQVASEAQIEILAESADGKKTASFTLPYVPVDATREGSVSFEEKIPITGFKSRVVGYSKP